MCPGCSSHTPRQVFSKNPRLSAYGADTRILENISFLYKCNSFLALWGRGFAPERNQENRSNEILVDVLGARPANFETKKVSQGKITYIRQRPGAPPLNFQWQILIYFLKSFLTKRGSVLEP